MNAKIGRPTIGNPKTIEVKARIDEETNEKLKEFCRKNNLTRTDVVRMGIEKVYIDLDVEVGDTVRVISGPFESFMGEVLDISKEKQILTVRVSMFGRDTPVELEFGQVDKIL